MIELAQKIAEDFRAASNTVKLEVFGTLIVIGVLVALIF